MIDSVYGKKNGNLRKMINVRLINNANNNKKYVSKPGFVSQKIFEIKPVLELDKPVYLGLSILDLMIFLMYEFHYKYIERKYDNSAKLLFTETDSLIYDIKTDRVNEDFYKDKNVFDFSDYPEDFKFFNPVNKKVIFKMKDRKMKLNHRENNQ